MTFIGNKTDSSCIVPTLSAIMHKADAAAPQGLETKSAAQSPKDALSKGLNSACKQVSKELGVATQAVGDAMTAGAGYGYLSLVSAKLTISPLFKAPEKPSVFRSLKSTVVTAGAFVADVGQAAAGAVCAGATWLCAYVAHISASLKGIVVGFATKMFAKKTPYAMSTAGSSAVSSTASLASFMPGNIGYDTQAPYEILAPQPMRSFTASPEKGLLGTATETSPPKTPYLAPTFGASVVSSTESLPSATAFNLDEDIQSPSKRPAPVKMGTLEQALKNGLVADAGEYYAIIAGNITRAVNAHVASQQATQLAPHQDSPQLRAIFPKSPIVVLKSSVVGFEEEEPLSSSAASMIGSIGSHDEDSIE
jgi:hypothetical protein